MRNPIKLTAFLLSLGLLSLAATATSTDIDVPPRSTDNTESTENMGVTAQTPSAPALDAALAIDKAATDPQNLLALIDSYRGLSDQGFSFDITNVSYKKGRDPRTNQLSVDVQDEKSLVKFMAPARQKGRVLLKKDNDMWLYIPGTRKVIRISPAQRLLGETSNGDVAGTNYADDYTAKITTTDEDKQNAHIRLTLEAKNKRQSYAKVVFWLADDNSHKPVRSEYYARSGKLLKTAHYKEYKAFDGQEKIHKLLLVDPLMEGSYTWMRFDNYRASELPEAVFSKEAMVNL